MSVDLEPSELGFKRPFTHEVAQVLRLSNPNSDPVAFKVKTTAPKQYCVRPNSGRIEAGQDVEVQVLLQAMKEDPAPDARCRDKFLVQSVAIRPESDANTVTQIWSNVEQNAKSSVQEKKIRVSWLPADTKANGTSAAGGASTYEDEPPAYSTPARSTATAHNDTAAGSKGDESILSSVAQQAASSASAAAAAVTSALPASQDDLKKQLEDAKATIARLQAQAAEGLRQRKPQEAAAKATESMQRSLQTAPAPGGVPIQIVALLCLICFLVAYFFF